MPELTLVDAINLALARALTDDPDVLVFGEDVGVNGGVFRATAGLQQRFGAERVFKSMPACGSGSGDAISGGEARRFLPARRIRFNTSCRSALWPYMRLLRYIEHADMHVIVRGRPEHEGKETCVRRAGNKDLAKPAGYQAPQRDLQIRSLMLDARR